MTQEFDFETFLFISTNKYQIFVYDKNNFKNLYYEEIKINKGIDLNNLSNFLDQNIYKIEKAINSFIRNIILIIEDNEVFDVSISIRKKNYEKDKDQKHLENSLIEVKDVFREGHQDQIIMHMIILNNDYSFLEVNFVSISSSFTYIFDKLLENHQIKIRRYMSGSYIKSYFGENATELSMMANKLNNGLNKNEVQLVSKNVKNKGFFEKFFQLFS